MYSPIDRNTNLVRHELEPGLNVLRCPLTDGLWIPLDAYLAWREHSQSKTTPLPPDFVPQIADHSARKTLLCPESGCLLIRYRVGQGLDFHVEHSPKTGGVWLDAGEWEALKSKNLHADIPLLFSASHQHKLQLESSAELLREQFKQKLGQEDFSRVMDFQTWLQAHPRRRDILSYLMTGRKT